MDTLRRPLFFLAVALMAVVVLVEIGSTAVLGALAPRQLPIAQTQLPPDVQADFQNLSSEQRAQINNLSNQSKPPGIGIQYLALIDGIVLFTVVLMGLSLLVPESVTGRVQGCATFIFALLVILGGMGLIFAAIALVTLMISLLLAVPFGTIVYFAVYGFFNVGGARATLGLLMLLKLGFAASLLLAQQRFLQNGGLVLLVFASLAGNVIVSFLQGFVPGSLVSITDAIAAIVVGVVAVLLAALLLIFSLVAILKAVRL
jgi:hypothetical protein